MSDDIVRKIIPRQSRTPVRAGIGSAPPAVPTMRASVRPTATTASMDTQR
jgi:hypothetical protein